MKALWHFIVFYFAVPYGAVWGNILAIVPTAIIGFIWLDIKNEIRHQELKLKIKKEKK